MRILTITLLVLSCFIQKIYSANQNIQLKAIDILNIVSTAVDDHIELSWESNEYENNYFMIVEKSNDGVYFTSLDTIYNIGLQYYTYIDAQPLTGISYYRIRCAYSNSQSETISNITYIEYKMQQNDPFEILNSFPIPFSEKLNTRIRCKTNMMLNIKLIGHKGSVIYESSKMCNEGINSLEFSEILNTGNSFYYLTLSDENSNLKTVQLLKQNTH
jgi:hypothetical protein